MDDAERRKEDARRRTRGRIALCVLAVGGVLAGAPELLARSGHARVTPRAVAGAELQRIRGGISTTSVTPSTHSASGLDNIAFAVGYENDFSDRAFAIFADSTKVAQTTIAANTTGTWYTRTQWPESGYKTITTRYDDYSGGWGVSYTGPTHGVDSYVHMIDLQVWNSQLPGFAATTVTATQVAGVVDNLTYLYYQKATNTIDALYSQCTVAKRMQFRWAGVSPTVLSLSSCPAPLPGLTGSAPLFGLPQACVNQAYNGTTNNGSNNTKLNIVVVSNMGDGGFHIRQTSNPQWYWITLQQNWFNNPAQLTRVLAHEIGHWVLYKNSSQHAPTYSCGQAGEPACGSDPTKCGKALVGGSRVATCNANNNVMCSSDSWCGRSVVTAQCDDAATAWPFYYVDHN